MELKSGAGRKKIFVTQRLLPPLAGKDWGEEPRLLEPPSPQSTPCTRKECPRRVPAASQRPRRDGRGGNGEGRLF
jgi:hypothetical protein